MKRTIVILLLALSLAPVAAGAQNVYNFVLENAQRIVNNPTVNFTQTRIAQFKVTALCFLRQTGLEKMSGADERWLDVQAYYLSEFLTLFFKELVSSDSLPDDERKAHILRYTEATMENPLFDQVDEETALAYLKETGEITPFSLNTDWEKAFNYLNTHSNTQTNEQ